MRLGNRKNIGIESNLAPAHCYFKSTVNNFAIVLHGRKICEQNRISITYENVAKLILDECKGVHNIYINYLDLDFYHNHHNTTVIDKKILSYLILGKFFITNPCNTAITIPI